MPNQPYRITSLKTDRDIELLNNLFNISFNYLQNKEFRYLEFSGAGVWPNTVDIQEKEFVIVYNSTDNQNRLYTKINGNLSYIGWNINQRIQSYIISGTAQTSISLSSLDGDTDKEYELRMQIKDSGAGGGSTLYMRFNNDTGNNYKYRGLNVDSVGTVNGFLYDPTDKILLGRVDNNNMAIVNCKIATTTSTERMCIINENTGLTFNTHGGTWKNSANNITSIQIFSPVTNGIGIGSVIDLYAR